jgi:hypothetical protein
MCSPRLNKSAHEPSASPIQTLSGAQDPSAEQRKSSATIHHPFDQLESIDMALDDPIAVWQSQRRRNGQFVLLNSSPKKKEIYPTYLEKGRDGVELF